MLLEVLFHHRSWLAFPFASQFNNLPDELSDGRIMTYPPSHGFLPGPCWSHLFYAPRPAPVLDLESRMRTIRKTLSSKNLTKKNSKESCILSRHSLSRKRRPSGALQRQGLLSSRKERQWIHLLQQVWPRGHQIMQQCINLYQVSNFLKPTVADFADNLV